MARNPKPTKKSTDRRPKRSVAGSGRPRRGRPKVCMFCADCATWVDYKDVALLKRFTNDRGRLKARGATGTCAQHQRDVASAVKTARELALLPYAVRTASGEMRGGRGRDGHRNPATSTAPDAAPDNDTDGSGSEVEPDVADSPTAAPA
jgi:small subunit ribosomal protein S18